MYKRTDWEFPENNTSEARDKIRMKWSNSAKESNKGSLLIFADKYFRQKSINDTANQKYDTVFMNVKKNLNGFTPTLLSYRTQIFLEMGVLKNFANFTWNTYFWVSF